jgi:hypothetical protein
MSVALAADQSFPMAAGTTATWTATVAGGAAPYQYQFRVYDASVGWRTVRDFSSDNTLTWAPTVSGTYQVEVRVWDTGSTALYDASRRRRRSPLGRPLR